MRYLICLLFAAFPALLFMIAYVVYGAIHPQGIAAGALEPYAMLAIYASFMTIPAGVIAMIFFAVISKISKRTLKS